MSRYQVHRAGWLTDGRGVAALRAVGETVEMSERQAAYLLRSGQITPVVATKAAGPKAPSSGRKTKTSEA